MPQPSKNGNGTDTLRHPADGVNRSAHTRDITALLLDDTPLTRECLSISLNLCDRGLHVLTAASVAEVEAVLRSEAAPDVVLCHVGGAAPSEPRFLDTLRDLVAMLGGVPLIVLSDHEDAGAALDVFRMGVRGYIPTSVGLPVALEAIRLVGAGGTFIPTTFLQTLMREEGPPVQPPCVTDRIAECEEQAGDRQDLTPRQLAVMKCLREGKANKVIAHELGMCESTVKVHVRNILKKLGATNRTQAVYLTYGGHPMN